MSRERTSRREFFGQTLALGTACLTPGRVARADDHAAEPAGPLVVDTTRTYLRKGLPEFVKDSDMLRAFRDGVGRMRALAPDHPFSWIFQANIHARPNFPSYVYDQAASGTANAAQRLFRDDLRFSPCPNVFNQCAHYSWWFLPWHRAYVFFFERILRWASGRRDFALPYWNYADPAQRALPLVFREELADGKPNPLYLPATTKFTDDQHRTWDYPMRDPGLNQGRELDPCLVRLCPLTRIPFSNSPPDDADSCFGGQRADQPGSSPVSGQGAQEKPHGQIHKAIGGNVTVIGGQLMSGFMHFQATAARDPLFWMHHCNIDRLWVSWLDLNDGRMNPLDSQWLDQPFTFYDVHHRKPKAVTVRVYELLDPKSQLGYEYDCLSTDLTGCDPPPPTGITQIVARLASQPADLAPSPDANRIRLKTTESRSATVPLLAGVTGRKIQDLARGLCQNPNGALALSLEQVDLKEPSGVYFEMYLNLPTGVAPSPADPHYVGSLSFFGTGHHGAGHGDAAPPEYFRFVFPKALLNALADEKDLKEFVLTFDPKTGRKAVGQVALKPRIEFTPAIIARVQILQLR
jgi:tyrosinase